MARDPSTEARCTPAALTMMPSIRQRSEQHHRRPYPQPDPLPVTRAVAPCIDLRAQQPERGALQHCSRVHAQTQRSFPEGSSFHKFLLASNARSNPERARALRLAPLPRLVLCRRQWYISKLLCDGDSNKIIPPSWRGRHPSPPAATAAHADYGRAHGRLNHLYSGVGE